jgi:prepilin-type N-terminal cleavage/methylation domain-containing protein
MSISPIEAGAKVFSPTASSRGETIVSTRYPSKHKNTRWIKGFPRRGFSMVEIFVVLFIVAILSTIPLLMYSVEEDKLARNNLWLAFQAQQDFFAYSAPHETYSSGWSKLFCKDLNTKDRNFRYVIEKATSRELLIKAISKKNPKHFLTIDNNAILKDERGRIYNLTSGLDKK